MSRPRLQLKLGLTSSMLCGLLWLGCGGDTTQPEEGKDQDESPAQDDDEVAEDKPKDAGKDAARRDARPAEVVEDAGEQPEPDAGPDKQPEDAGTTRPPSSGGPVDGDPSKPVVSLPNIKCVAGGGGLNPLGSANLQVGGRDVILDYPCEKHEGAKVTFILNLHGTMAMENIKFYQHGYFAAHTLATSHNLIVATPKSRASQWGNTGENPDAAQDLQHLLDVIDYVYTNFAKFEITGLWVAGHSWGSMYAKRFVCEEAIKDKAVGVVGMSGGATLPGGRAFGASDLKLTTNCQDYISQIHTVGDMDSVTGLPEQTAAATKHGCDAKTPAKDLGKMQMSEEWPSCDPGWVHEGITMGDHQHTTSINPEVVKHIVEQIKKTEAP